MRASGDESVIRGFPAPLNTHELRSTNGGRSNSLHNIYITSISGFHEGPYLERPATRPAVRIRSSVAVTGAG